MLFSTPASSAVVHPQPVTTANNGPTSFTATKHVQQLSQDTSPKKSVTNSRPGQLPGLYLIIQVRAHTNLSMRSAEY